MEKEVLAVGDSTQLEIIFSTKKYRNRVTKSPRITTNEGPPDKNVQIIATVVPRPDSTYPIIVQPYKLDLSQKTKKTIDKIEFRIKNVSDEDLDVSLVSSASDYFEVKLPKSIDAGDSKKATVKLLKSALDKSFEKSFTIQVSDESGSRFTIPVKRSLVGAAARRPSSK